MISRKEQIETTSVEGVARDRGSDTHPTHTIQYVLSREEQIETTSVEGVARDRGGTTADDLELAGRPPQSTDASAPAVVAGDRAATRSTSS